MEDDNRLLEESLLRQYSENSILVTSNKLRVPGEVIQSITTSDNSISQILESLYKENINSVLVEGGRMTLQRFIDSDLWDECRIITGETQICDGLAAPVLDRSAYKEMRSGSDMICFYMNK